MANRAQDLIKSFYDEEIQRKEREITFSDYTVRLNTSDIAMLDTIAKRFGKASERIASEAVSAAVYAMVEALETAERKKMAKEADDLNESFSKKAAKANGQPEFDEKSVTWVMNDRAITRDENRIKKEMEDKNPPKLTNEVGAKDEQLDMSNEDDSAEEPVIATYAELSEESHESMFTN